MTQNEKTFLHIIQNKITALSTLQNLGTLTKRYIELTLMSHDLKRKGMKNEYKMFPVLLSTCSFPSYVCAVHLNFPSIQCFAKSRLSPASPSSNLHETILPYSESFITSVKSFIIRTKSCQQSKIYLKSDLCHLKMQLFV